MTESKSIEEKYSLKYYVIFFIIIFISDDTFNFGTNNNFVYIIIKYVLYLILTVYLLLKSNLSFLIKVTKSSLVFYAILLSISGTIFFNFDISGGYIYQFWLLFLGFSIANFFSNEQFIDVYLRFLYVLTYLSLGVFIIANVFPSIIYVFPVQINSAEANVYNLGFCMVSFENAFVRNMSIFREPGVFMIYLNLGILFELFFKSRMNKKHLFVFIAAIFTTLSTAAFIIVAAIFVAYLFTKTKDKLILKNKVFIISLIFVAVIVIIASTELRSMIFDKIGKDNISDGSSLSRAISVLANLKIFSDNIFFGVGIKNYPLFFEKYTRDLIGFGLDVGNNTNTITTVFAVYGFFFGALFIFMLVSFSKKTSNLIIVRSLVFLVLIMLYSNEDLRYSLMSATLLMWGLINRKKTEN